MTDHCNTFTPTFNVTAVVAEAVLAMVPPPCKNDHVPLCVYVVVLTAYVLDGTAFAEIVVTEFVTQSV